MVKLRPVINPPLLDYSRLVYQLLRTSWRGDRGESLPSSIIPSQAAARDVEETDGQTKVKLPEEPLLSLLR